MQAKLGIQCSAEEGSNSLFNIFDLMLVAYSHPLFQTSIILFDLLLVPVTVQLTTVFNQFIYFFVKKSKSNHKSNRKVIMITGYFAM